MIKLKIKYGNSQTDLRFPCTEKEMNAALERIHAEDVTPLELYVSEVIFPEELGCLQDRFVNLDEVNFLGKRMDSFCPPFTANSITAGSSASSPARTPSASSPMRSLPRNRPTARTWTRTTAPSWECRRLPIGTRYFYTAAAGRYLISPF